MLITKPKLRTVDVFNALFPKSFLSQTKHGGHKMKGFGFYGILEGLNTS